MRSYWLRAFVLLTLASSAACSANVEPTEATAEAIIRHPAPPAPLTTIQKACGATVTAGGCIQAVTLDIFGAFAGSNVTLTGYFEPGSTVTVDGAPARVYVASSDTNPTHIDFELPPASPGPHVVSVMCNGSAAKNEISDGPLRINYLAPRVDGVSPSEIPVGASHAISVNGHGLSDGMSINVGDRVAVLSNCTYWESTDTCNASAPSQPGGTYDVFFNTCPGAGECYSPIATLTYAIGCDERYLVRGDHSVFDVNTGKTWSYNGQDTQQYCGAYYGCASPSLGEMDSFFIAFGSSALRTSCAYELALLGFPTGKYWSNVATRTGEDTYTAQFYESSGGAIGTENGDDSHGCICAR